MPREKRARKEGKSPVIEKVPTFLTPRAVPVEEDPSPYVVEWGLPVSYTHLTLPTKRIV